MGSGHEQRIEVLVEVAGTWRLIQTHPHIHFDGEISHITEPAGIATSKVDYLK